jgi:hypothetical protein
MFEKFLYLLWRNISFAMQPSSGRTETQSRYKSAHSNNIVISEVPYRTLHIVITYKKPVTLIYLTSAFYILRKNCNVQFT